MNVNGMQMNASMGEGRLFRKGTLVYTRSALVVLFFYLLWGDFCMQMMETVIPQILPLQLKNMGASNTMMGLLVTTLPSVFNFTMNPIVSFRSDSFRSRWGRRIPFLMFATPFVTLALVLMAFVPEFSAYFGDAGWVRSLSLSPATVMLCTMTAILVMFQLFNYCLTPVYYYLLVDVVPDEMMGRFMALFRVVMTASSYLFNTFLFGKALTHTREIYIGAALLYFVSFMVMCWRVREGEYPPPVHGKRMGLAKSVEIYARECYSHRHYLFFNARNAFFYLASSVGLYSIFIFRDELGLPLEFIGKINGYSGLIVMALLFPFGMLADKFKPVRVLLMAMIVMPLLPLLSYLFLRGPASYVVFTLVNVPFAALCAASELPFHVSLLPRERYGQFGSANMIVCSLTLIIGSIVAGKYMDWATSGGTVIANYRYLYLWMSAFQFLALIFMVLLYRSWRRHGGPDHYVPPSSNNGAAMRRD